MSAADRWIVPTVRDLTGVLWSLLVTALGVGVALLVVPRTGADGPQWVLLVAAVVALGDALLRPLLRLVAARVGAVVAIVLALAAQLVVALAALRLLPGIDSGGWGRTLVVLLVAAVVMAVGQALVGADDEEYVVADVLRRARRAERARVRRGGEGAPEGARPGLLVVQLDGVSRSTFDHAVQAGLVPHVASWLEAGTHTAGSWWARVPCTTPASQAGLLHGESREVPAFRWWDRGERRLVVTNRPADAALVEARVSDGAGLLAHDGVAVSTMFSGDAPTSLLVMSRTAGRGGLGPGHLFVHFFSSPFVLARAMVGTVGETLKEYYQGWKQAVRGVRPRVRRLGWFPVLRGVSNVVLRDLNVSLVAEQLVHGAPVVFVDLVDYDEIAHHAGPLRPESLRALEGLDRVVGLWERVAQAAPRDYRIVVLSDHGQSLGETFATVVGRTFGEEVRRLVADAPGPAPSDVLSADLGSAELPSADLAPAADVAGRRPRPADDEAWGAVNTALNAFSRAPEGRVVVGRESRHRSGDADGTEVPEVVVVGSGNLGLVWFPRLDARPRGDEIRGRWPRLLPGLLANPTVGVVVTREAPTHVERGDEPVDVVAHGPAGRHNLTTGVVVGVDPLARYGARAAPDLLRAAHLEHAGDVLLVSAVDGAGLVHAFEGLVGSHGGLGGAQNEALLVRPVDLEVPAALLEDVDGTPMLVGAEAVHERLVAWSRELGLRP
ncbi:type I phosphodiesterase/nucleotide pyrophosphatase [Sediminihabitans luteus]|uniref:Type I phosphodiesterase/nucleotide pyrophosphatase n=1 Tax=Sediminihabitans luteus TaxID=1138585 RepID=A0A2M9CCG5_9CELL|nr:alkaline phosphatase family protein [Sediminihabitans luteus]PJJ69039.1 type I phosphodiesterase/nucleotide pyrophosphatase [Sediminihabitans luteus]GII99425.1 membrane protein [Sediminihabitans luteus]